MTTESTTGNLTLAQVTETIDLLLAEQHRCWSQLAEMGEAWLYSLERDRLVSRVRQLDREVDALYVTKRHLQASAAWELGQTAHQRKSTKKQIDRAFKGLRRQWFRQAVYQDGLVKRDRKRTLSWREMSGPGLKRRAA